METVSMCLKGQLVAVDMPEPEILKFLLLFITFAVSLKFLFIMD